MHSAARTLSMGSLLPVATTRTYDLADGPRLVAPICGRCGAEVAPRYALTDDDDESIVQAGMSMLAQLSTAQCGTSEQAPGCTRLRQTKAAAAIEGRRQTRLAARQERAASRDLQQA